MKITFLTLTAIALAGCQAKVSVSSKPSEDKKPPVAEAQATPTPKPAPMALATSDVLACDRRSILYDPSEHVRPDPPPKPKAIFMKPGETAYVAMLTSSGGHVYVYSGQETVDTPQNGYPVMIRRVTDGFLVDCDSPEMWIWLDEGAKYRSSMADLIPVIGHIDVKPKKAKVDKALENEIYKLNHRGILYIHEDGIITQAEEQ